MKHKTFVAVFGVGEPQPCVLVTFFRKYFYFSPDQYFAISFVIHLFLPMKPIIRSSFPFSLLWRLKSKDSPARLHSSSSISRKLYFHYTKIHHEVERKKKRPKRQSIQWQNERKEKRTWKLKLIKSFEGIVTNSNDVEMPLTEIHYAMKAICNRKYSFFILQYKCNSHYFCTKKFSFN